MRDQCLGIPFETLGRDAADVIARREDRVLAGDDQAANLDPGVQPGDRRGDRVEDLVIKRVPLRRVGNREAGDRLGRKVEPDLVRPRVQFQ